MKLVFCIYLFFTLHEAMFAQHCLAGRYSELALFDSTEIIVLSNIQYGQATNYFSGQNVNLLMDVYYPNQNIDDMEHRPFIMLIHGGGFAVGDKNELSFVSFEFARRGFVVANINYRLGWNCDNAICFNCYESNMQKAIYCAVQDARAAMRFAYEQREEWGIDVNWMFCGGESAGSITSLLATYWDDTEAAAHVPAGFTSEVGPLDGSGNNLPNLFSIKANINHCGAIYSLSELANNPNIPIISFHDSNDCLVPYNSGPLIACFCNGFLYMSGSNQIHYHQVQNGQCSELHTAPQILPNHCTFPSANWMKLTSCFLKRVMCGFCMSFADSDIYAQPICANMLNTSNTVLGCTYMDAENYNPSATEDDGSCIFINSCAGDFDMDGIVDVDDLMEFISSFGDACP